MEQSYADWMVAVAAACVKRCGMHPSEMPDVDFRTLYDQGESCDEAARSAEEQCEFMMGLG